MKKKNRMTRIAFVAAMAIVALMSPHKASAQAFDGDMDEKVRAGYLNLSGKSGAELGYTNGLSDCLSYGVFARMLFDDGNDERGHSLLESLDIGAECFFHWDELLHLPSPLDIYTGFQLGWQSGGLAGGLKYNISERWGLYVQAQQGLFDVSHSKVFDYPFNGRKFGVSAGVTFSLQ